MASELHKAHHGVRVLAKAVEHAPGTGRAHPLEHAQRIGVGLTRFVPVVIANVQLNGHVALDGEFELTDMTSICRSCGAASMSSTASKW